MDEWQNAWPFITLQWGEQHVGFMCVCGYDMILDTESGEKPCPQCGRTYRCAFTFEVRIPIPFGVSTEGAAWASEVQE